jgi:thiol-disulfide isomerase/thioredoxin
VGALTGAVLASPIGKDITVGADAGPAPTAEPTQLRPSDQRLLAVGRTAPQVGRSSPAVSFLTFGGTRVELHNRTRPVVLMFLGSPCSDCQTELEKLAATAAILYDEAWIGLLAAPAVGDDVQNLVVESGGTDLYFAGTDDNGAIARSFDIERTPATVVLDTNHNIAAVWQRSIPAGAMTQLVKSLEGG